MAELEDALALESGAETHAGSSPVSRPKMSHNFSMSDRLLTPVAREHSMG